MLNMYNMIMGLKAWDGDPIMHDSSFLRSELVSGSICLHDFYWDLTRETDSRKLEWQLRHNTSAYIVYGLIYYLRCLTKTQE